MRLPEIASTCTFISPPRRKHQIIDIQAIIIVTVDLTTTIYFAVERSYHSYRLNDDLLDFLNQDKYQAASGQNVHNIVGFWCDLYLNFPEYNELSKLAILILTIISVICECECGFSTMNNVKNELHTAMIDRTMNACLCGCGPRK